MHFNGSRWRSLRSFLPAEKKGYVEERGEVSEELEGEHLDGETPLSGSE